MFRFHGWGWSFIVPLFALSIAAVVLYVSSGYNLGDLRRIGPGAFPVGLGVVLVGLAILSFLDRGRADPAGSFQIRPVLAVGAAMISFALILPRFGLVPASAITLAIASAASTQSRLVEVIALAVGLPMLLVGIFIYGLSLPIPAFAW